MKNIVNLLLLLSPILFFKNYVKAGEGVLIWHDWYRVSTFKCLKENSKEFVIVSANYYDSGEANLNAELNIINARTAGIENVDIYFSPCVKPSTEYELCGNASGSITKVLNYLNDNNIKFGRVWLYIVYGADDCENLNGWDKDNKTSNGMVNTLKERKQDFGFMTRKYNWHEITGNTRKYNDTPLIYFHLDGQNNFDDYGEYGYPFGGWEKPTMKGYENKINCEINVTANIFSDTK
uniref:Uncharacterized protein n=1 Tax=Meloidogyne enterolobii TaxID=390850 RepID=A0A6V7YBL2_MELEN|nr:unnamed protein product [Meloidogyne enterolobii]